MNSKRKRTRRTLLRSAKRKLLNFVLISALLLIVGLKVGLRVYRGSVFTLSSSASDGGRSQSSSVWQSTGAAVGEASTDITTKGLYDEIAFEDEEGGVWRQGWNVQYKGSEWDHEELKVFVVPHSHNDPGWIRTVEEYYQERSRNILSTIVQALKKVHYPSPLFVFQLCQDLILVLL